VRHYEQSWDNDCWGPISIEVLKEAARPFYQEPDEILGLLDQGVTVRIGALYVRRSQADYVQTTCKTEVPLCMP
jgi:hypothetical protein